VAFALVVLLVALPILEIYVIVQVGQVIGAAPTILLLLAGSLFGAWLIRASGRRAWAAMREASATGHMPDREISDAGLVLVGGILLFIPGFVTDVVGLMFVLPFLRPLTRRSLRWYFARRVRVVAVGSPGYPGYPLAGQPLRSNGRGEVPPAKGEVIEGIVVEDRFETGTGPAEDSDDGIENPPDHPRR
jgi:UPF0716 protein FxsA